MSYEQRKHQHICTYCGKIFFKPNSRIPNHNRKFCSQKCFGLWKRGRDAKNIKQHKIPNTIHGNTAFVTCAQCGKLFETPLHRINSKDKPKFCSSQCNGLAKRKVDTVSEQVKNNNWRKHNGWTEFSKTWIKAGDGCEICSEQNRKKLIVHHIKDPNQTKDLKLLFDSTNLQILCRSCHAKIHKSQKN